MGFQKDYVGGALIVQGQKIKVQSTSGSGYTEITATERVQSATWSGDDIIVVTQSGKAYRYTNNATYSYA